MTRLSCPTCRLRFPTAASQPEFCPECSGELQPVPSAEAVLGYRLFDVLDAPPAPPIAADTALPIILPPPDLS